MFELLRPRLPRLLMAILFGVLSLGSALALAAVSAWLITRAWQMPPVLDLTVAVVAVRALGISRGVMGYCERLASHDTALRAGADVRERLYAGLASGPADAFVQPAKRPSVRRQHQRVGGQGEQGFDRAQVQRQRVGLGLRIGGADAVHIVHRRHVNASMRNDRRCVDRFAREAQLR